MTESSIPFPESPFFHFPELKRLYYFSENLPIQDVLSICRLPENELIPDLLLIIKDAIDNFEKYEVTCILPEHRMFPVIALEMLSALNAEGAASTVTELFRQPAEFRAFWFDTIPDLPLVSILHPVFRNELFILEQFMFEAVPDKHWQRMVPFIVAEILKNDPTRKIEISNWFETVLDHYRNKFNSGIKTDVTQVSYLLKSMKGLNLESLQDKIQWFIDQDLMQEEIAGNKETYITDFKKEMPERLPAFNLENGLLQLKDALHLIHS